MPEPGVATTADIALVVDHLKRSAQTMGALQSSVATLSQGVERLARSFTSATADIKSIGIAVEASRQEAAARFAAVGDRFTELESVVDAVRSEIKASAADIIAQDLQILTAVQSALGARTQIDELTASLDEVRTHLGI